MLYIQMMQFGGGQSLTPTVMAGIREGNSSRWGLLKKTGRYGRSPYFEWGKFLDFRLEVRR